MLKLVFLVCLSGSPDTCDERVIPIFDRVSPMGCMMQAPATLAQWRETHPGWSIARWRCSNDRRAEAAQEAG